MNHKSEYMHFAPAQPVALDRAQPREITSGEEWQIAGERILLYMKGLGANPEEQLGLALEAIRRARANRPGTRAPIADSLETLWLILQERNQPLHLLEVGACSVSPSNRSAPPHASAAASRPCSELAHPPMRRQSMISAPMELSPWRNAAVRLIEAVRGPLEEIFYFRGRIVGAVLTLLLILALK